MAAETIIQQKQVGTGIKSNPKQKQEAKQKQWTSQSTKITLVVERRLRMGKNE